MAEPQSRAPCGSADPFHLAAGHATGLSRERADPCRTGRAGANQSARPALGHRASSLRRGVSWIAACPSARTRCRPRAISPSSGLARMNGSCSPRRARKRQPLRASARRLPAPTAAVTDVSGNLARLRLSGDHARDVLAKGCSLDLHPRQFQPGQCAQTLILRCGIILHQIDERPSYDLLPRRSFAEYLWMWLSDAMAEYGGRVVTES